MANNSDLRYLASRKFAFYQRPFKALFLFLIMRFFRPCGSLPGRSTEHSHCPQAMSALAGLSLASQGSALGAHPQVAEMAPHLSFLKEPRRGISGSESV